MNDLMIVAALLHAPACGYALKKTAGITYGNRVLHPNMVYPLLKKVEENGWVAQSSIAGERGQTRKQYRIPASGNKHLIEELSNFTEHDASDHKAFLFRVANFDTLTKQKRQQILNVRKQFFSERGTQLKELSEHIKPESFRRIALDCAQDFVRDELRWIDGPEAHKGSKK